MNRRAAIATHHKTGTVWMRLLFQRIAKKLELRFVLLDKKSVPERPLLAAPVIVLDDHSEFINCRWLLEEPDCRLLHIIRDPRDVIISAAHYHVRAEEAWLHWPRKRFKGRSYQQTIRALRSDRARYLFEMKNSAGATIAAMRAWDYTRENAIEFKYEDMMADEDGSKIMFAFRHLGFEEGELGVCLKQYRRSRLSNEISTEVKPVHVRSGRARQWETIYDRQLGEKFVAMFGDLLIRLGYEANNAWVQSLPPRAAIAADGVLSGSGEGQPGH